MSIISDKQFLIYQLRQLFLKNKDGSSENVISDHDLKLFQTSHNIPYLKIIELQDALTPHTTPDDYPSTFLNDASPNPLDPFQFGFETQFKPYDYNFSKKDSINLDLNKKLPDRRLKNLSNPRIFANKKHSFSHNLNHLKRVKSKSGFISDDSSKTVIKSDLDIIKHFDQLNNPAQFDPDYTNPRSTSDISDRFPRQRSNKNFKPPSPSSNLLSKNKSLNNYTISSDHSKIIYENYLDNEEYIEINVLNKSTPSAKPFFNKNPSSSSRIPQNTPFYSKLSPLIEKNSLSNEYLPHSFKRSSSVNVNQGIPLSFLNTQTKDPKIPPTHKKSNLSQASIVIDDDEDHDSSDIPSSPFLKSRSLTFPFTLNQDFNLDYPQLKNDLSINPDINQNKDLHMPSISPLTSISKPQNNPGNIIALRKSSKDTSNLIPNSNSPNLGFLDLIMDPDHLEANAYQNKSNFKQRSRLKSKRSTSNLNKNRFLRPLSMRFDIPKRGTIAAIRPISVLFSSGESDSDYDLDDDDELSYIAYKKILLQTSSSSSSKKQRSTKTKPISSSFSRKRSLSLPKSDCPNSSLNSSSSLLQTNHLNKTNPATTQSKSLNLSSSIRSSPDTLEPTAIIKSKPTKATSIILDKRLTQQLNSSKLSPNSDSKSTPITDAPSGLSLMFRNKTETKNPFQSEYSKYYMVGKSAQKFVIFLPESLIIKSDNLSISSLVISVNNSVSTEQTIGFVLYQYLEKYQSNSLLDEKLMNVIYWSMRIAEPDGEIDFDFPVLDRSQSISKFGSTDFALCLASQQEVEANRLIKEKSDQSFNKPTVDKFFNNNTSDLNQNKSIQKNIPELKNLAEIDNNSDDSSFNLSSNISKLNELAMGKITNQAGIVRLVKVFFWHNDEFNQPNSSQNTQSSNTQLIKSTTVQIKVSQSIYDVLLIVCKKFGYSARSYSLTDSKNPTQYLDPSISIHNLSPATELYLMPINLISKEDSSLKSELSSSNYALVSNSSLSIGSPMNQSQTPFNNSKLDPIPFYRSFSSTNDQSFYHTFTVTRKMQFFSKYQQNLVIDGKFIAMVPIGQRSDVSNTITIPVLNVTVKKSSKYSKKLKLITVDDLKHKKTYDIEASNANEAEEIFVLIERHKLKYSLERRLA
ncbi:Stress-activated map kinase-interacting protein 1 [Smittium culicis]|uniref:Stress-activated map kinase-interacting protein 1 n=1 Tax=Smittium culicis TaxID=133412 RepID=A0A1R1YPZ7_9FUNG|nr:Stress-activated map kinase-interacting protein 1 [Smittium culicis]